MTQELIDPRRTIATSVCVAGDEWPLASVRLTQAIPKDRIFDVMAEINKQKLTALVHIGDVVIENVLGLGSNVIVTKNVGKAYLHIHTTLCDKELKAHGGHATELRVAATCEIVVCVLPGEVDRKLHENIGLNLFHFA